MGFQDQILLNAGQKYYRMLQWEHSAILLTCIELPHGFKTFVLSIFEWPLKTGFTVKTYMFIDKTCLLFKILSVVFFKKPKLIDKYIF